MFRTFKQSFAVKNTYRANSIIYYLKAFPFIGKKLPNTLYSDQAIKQVVLAISVLVEVVTTFLGKIIYMLLLLGTAVMMKENMTFIEFSVEEMFFHIMVFLSLAGGWVNCYVMEMKKDNYYTIALMRMEAKKVIVGNFIYFLLRAYIGNALVFLILGSVLGLDWMIILLLPIYIVECKVIGGTFKIWLYARKKSLKNFQKMALLECAESLVFFLPAYGFLALGYSISTMVFYIVVSVLGILTGICMKYILKSQAYKRIYRKILGESDLVLNPQKKNIEQNKKMLGDKIDSREEIRTTKEGYAYLNHIFISRHRKMLAVSVKRIAIVEICILLLIVVACFRFPEMKTVLNEILVTILPMFLFFMYVLNRGQYITRAMFVNCDCQMLHYRFYKRPDAILGLFKERLKSIILMDLRHSLILAIGLPLLLLLTGGTDNPLEYVLLFISIVAMSVFFSVHNLFLYYVLQPYNEQVEMKNPIFAIASMLTYIFSYVFISRPLPLFLFGTAISAFCVIYILFALLLVYKLAPRTFRIR